MLTIRPFAYDDADYAALAALLATVWPDRDVTIPALCHRDQALSNGYFFARLLAERAGELVGVGDFGEPANSYRPGKYFFELSVRPKHERQGIGTALYTQILRQLTTLPQPATVLTCRSQEDRPQAVHFLQRHGFEQIMRSPLASLEVAKFQRAKFAGLIPKVEASGVQLLSISTLAQCDPDWQQRVYELDWECTLDEPLPDSPTKTSFDHYVTEIFANPDFLPDAWFIAVDQGRYVAMTATNRNARNPAQLDTFFTATVRSHRRRGIATALKLLAIDYAQEHNYKIIKTDNEEHNPMFQINLALGFVPEPALLFFQKKL